MRLTRCFIFAFSVIIIAPHAAMAGSNLDCIAAAKGRKILWNSSWTKDKSDNNVEYKVTNVTEVDRIPTRKVTLELAAAGSARLSHRTEVVVNEDRARAICERIIDEKPPLRFPDQLESDVESLPFIKYSKDGWVRAPFDKDVKLVLCRVGELRFSCPEADRLRFGGSLRTLEDDQKAQVPVQ